MPMSVAIRLMRLTRLACGHGEILCHKVQWMLPQDLVMVFHLEVLTGFVTKWVQTDQ